MSSSRRLFPEQRDHEDEEEEEEEEEEEVVVVANNNTNDALVKAAAAATTRVILRSWYLSLVVCTQNPLLLSYFIEEKKYELCNLTPCVSLSLSLSLDSWKRS